MSWQMEEAFTGEACCVCWQVGRLGSSLDSTLFPGPESIASVCLFSFLLKQGSLLVRECGVGGGGRTKYRKCGGVGEELNKAGV